ncbi:hypothetical protein N798_15605 [Knoellia flava TL1]|uniref:NodB homology domain-containing protein n=2 Tax=Knoellia flava TaxID=913969 RepID=A0A8H9FRK3_9MICO|nr:glycosyltransferase [Knoellia flava]KGN29037.1 hypothetical protein N798_15605 [Knoellia flava TL1]GGB70087.1 hypothetical protein GCM10011314_06740 [Knoellia flava]
MTHPDDLVTVVIPAHDVADYLDDCLESVVAQTHEHLEVILVDDGSTDATGSLCDAWAAREPRIRVIHQENHGPGHARNVGIALATGTLVTFLDSDDWWDRTFVATLVRAIHDHPGAGTAMCSFERVPGSAYDAGATTTTVLTPQEAVSAFAGRHHSLYVIPCAKLFRREILSPDIFPVGIVAEDAYVTHRLLMAAPVVLVPEPLYLYRQRPNSIMSRPFTVAQQLDEIGGSEQQVRDFTQAGLLRAAGWSADQAFRKRARLIAALRSTGQAGTAEQYAALALQSRSTKGLPRRASFRALSALAGVSPRLAVATFSTFTSWAATQPRPVPGSRKRIALTFDDGPAAATPDLVRYLVKQSAGATFFLRGDRSESEPDTVRLLHGTAGMEIGTHSHTHPDLHRVDAGGIRDELRRSAAAIESITGTRPVLFRPPMGHRSRMIDAIAGELGHPVILWSVNSMDFKAPGAAAAQVLANAHDGDIVLLHDTSTATLATTTTIVPALHRRGFELVTVSALLGDLSPGRVYRGATTPRVRFRRWRHLQRLRVARRVSRPRR